MRGNCNAGNEAAAVPQRSRADRDTKDPVATPMAGAKLESCLRSDDVRYRVEGKFLRVTAVPKVHAHVIKVMRALVMALIDDDDDDDDNVADASEDAGKVKVAPTSPMACARNKTETRTEKISSVHRESFWTKFDAEVRANPAKQRAATDPVAAYNDKKSNPSDLDKPKSAAT